jgi:hypothetical protein
MSTLSNDWVTSDLVDFEYKKYVLLAYLKGVKAAFDSSLLYPVFNELIFHFRNLKLMQENKQLLYETFPKEISRQDFKKLTLRYKRIVDDDDVMQEIEAIISYAMPLMERSLKEGKDLYEFVESKIEIQPIGISPLYLNEGYFFVVQPPKKQTRIFRYQLTLFENSGEQVRGLNTSLVDTVHKLPWISFEQMKLTLVKQFADLPNPATYLIDSELAFPFDETLMPVAKRILVKHIMRAA